MNALGWALTIAASSVACAAMLWLSVRAGEEDVQIEWQKLQDQGVDIEKLALRQIAAGQARDGRARIAAWRYRRIIPRMRKER